MNQRHLILLLIIPFVIAACSSAPSTAVIPEPQATKMPAAPAATPASAATAPAISAPMSSTDIATLERGRTPEGYHYLGRADAPLTILEFSDFLCTACAFHVEETEPAIIDAYVVTGKARIVYRHLLQLGEDSLRAAEAAECAGDQGKFWEMRDAIYRNQALLYSASDLGATLAYLAQTINLNLDKYNSCVQSRQHRARLEADFRAAQDAGVRSRPVFDIAGTRLVGARPFKDFQEIIERQ
ncbi:MAG: Rcas_1661 family thioredoxin-like (seleno)lipoprotein [Roseiflexus sp.]|nr:Rcas_1661 family thioredoxin-like (seleno)lipoprotein [Roseiflexus sp.]MCS7288998.1 Rcas_1661 family thioredoxin-like (seleno)lipoprotein [Roseiflexus sp.]MDW8147115.1 Rcas_1661 family thioredoxin-like (seleno)lipoprotein [Roseiflexaceae bacterium]MDW8231696.1 Rcas_1661 family thioredoxin-like (seleno)lipoprotein [Roseiflexaceae bacterium]